MWKYIWHVYEHITSYERTWVSVLCEAKPKLDFHILFTQLKDELCDGVNQRREPISAIFLTKCMTVVKPNVTSVAQVSSNQN